MFPGPVFYSELKTLSRRRRFYILRFAFGLLLLYFVVQTYSSLRWMFSNDPYATVYPVELTVSETALLGSRLFATVFWLQSIVVLFLTPALLAGAIAEDRQRRVLLYLLASPLNAAEIVLGKVAARLFNVVVIVASCFPIVSIALLFGGIDPLDLLLFYAGTFTAIYFLAGVSIAVSTATDKPREAILRTYFLALAWLAWPIIDVILRNVPASVAFGGYYREVAPYLDWATHSSPTSLFEVASPFVGPGGYLERVLWMMGLQLAYGTFFLIYSTLRLRPIEKGSRLLSRGDGASRSPVVRRLWGRRPCGDRPMIWKECTSSIVSKNLVVTIVYGLVILGAIGGLGYLAVKLGWPAFLDAWQSGYDSERGMWGSPRDELNTTIRVLTGALYVLLLFMLGGVSSTSFTSEREKDSWISLLATPLEGHEIITGKYLGSIWRVRHVLWFLLAIWAFGLVCGALHPLAFLLIVFLTALDVAFVAAFGCDVSLRSSSSARAIATTIGVLIVARGGYLFCCIPIFRDAEAIVFAGMTPLLVTASAARYSEVHDFFHSDRGVDPADWSAAVCVCILIHSYALLVLARDLPKRFEVEADRPDVLRRDSARLEYGGKVSTEPGDAPGPTAEV
jgi:ABC-type transport system involved in multi-copper enzyme maturation permease subunit